jgi:hypothetical protein
MRYATPFIGKVTPAAGTWVHVVVDATLAPKLVVSVLLIDRGK